MKLIRRLSSGLFSPKEIYEYRKDSRWFTFLFFILLVLISSISGVVSAYKTDDLEYSDMQEIREMFYRDGNKIPFVIKHFQLVGMNIDEDYQYKKTLGYIDIIITNGNAKVDEKSTVPTIVLTKNGVLLYYSIYREVLFSYSDYEELENLDLSLAYEDNSDFWKITFSVVAREMEKYHNLVVAMYMIIAVISQLLMLGIWSLIVAGLQKFSIGNKMKFSKLWQLMVYVTVPLALGKLLSDLFGIILIYYIGFILTVAYSAKLGQTIVTGGEKYEL